MNTPTTKKRPARKKKKKKTGVPEVKMLITALAFTATLGGWASFTYADGIGQAPLPVVEQVSSSIIEQPQSGLRQVTEPVASSRSSG